MANINVPLINEDSNNIGIGTVTPLNFKLQVGGNIGPDQSGVYSLGSLTLPWTASYIYSMYGTLFGNALTSTSSSFASASLTSLTSTSSSFASRSLFSTSASFASQSFSSSFSSVSLVTTSASFASRSLFSTSASFASQSLSASWTPVSVSASWASASLTSTSASFASQALTSSFAVSASWAPGGGTSESASWASASLSASWAPPIPNDYAISSSWASQSLSSSWAPPIASNFAISASWASQSFTLSNRSASINTNGKAGIGKLAGSDVLELQSDGNNSLIQGYNYGGAGMFTVGDAGVGLFLQVNDTASNYFVAITADDLTASLDLNNALNSNRVYITSENDSYFLNNGKIGMGTSTPTNKLTVVGNISASWITASLLGTSSFALTASSILPSFPYVTTNTSSTNWITCSFNDQYEYVNLTMSGSTYNFTASNLPTTGRLSDLSLFINNTMTGGTASLSFPSSWLNFNGGWPTQITASKSALIFLRAFGTSQIIGTYQLQA